MEAARFYGKPPFRLAVLHGGPGAPGEAAPLARFLGRETGVLEPLQSAASIAGQIGELKACLDRTADLPVTLVGHSWGAWLAVLFTSAHAGYVRRLILIGSPPFEERYVPLMNSRWSGRFTPAELDRIDGIQRLIRDPSNTDRMEIFRKFGRLMSRADTYQAVSTAEEAIEYQPEVYLGVMEEADRLRKTGALSEAARKISCPVLAIHGDFDPHPSEGVREPLEKILPDFRFVLLERCGHYPWNEYHAREAFWGILKKEAHL